MIFNFNSFKDNIDLFLQGCNTNLSTQYEFAIFEILEAFKKTINTSENTLDFKKDEELFLKILMFPTYLNLKKVIDKNELTRIFRLLFFEYKVKVDIFLYKNYDNLNYVFYNYYNENKDKVINIIYNEDYK